MSAKEQPLLIPLNMGINDSLIDDLLGVAFVRESKNTRFTVDRGVIRKAPISETLDIDDGSVQNVGGNSLIPLAGGKIAPLIVGSPAYPMRYVGASELDSIVPPNRPDEHRQNAYFPLEVVAAGGVSTPNTPNALYTNRAVIQNGDNLWIVSFAGYDDRGQGANGTCPVENEDDVNYGLWCTIVSVTDGRVVAPPQRLAVEGLRGFDALTGSDGARGPYLTNQDDPNSVVLWYSQVIGDTPPFTFEINARVLTLNGAGVDTGAKHTVYTPSGTVFSVSSEGYYGEGYADRAWLFCSRSDDINVGIVMRVDTATWSTSDAHSVIGTSVSTFRAVAARTIMFFETLPVEVMSIVWTDGSVSMGRHYMDTGVVMVALDSAFSTGPDGPVSVTHYHHNGSPVVATMSSNRTGDFETAGTPTSTSVVVYAYNLQSQFASPILQENYSFPWMVLYGQATSYCYGEPVQYPDSLVGQLLPVIPLIRMYDAGVDFEDPDYAADPALELMTCAWSRVVPEPESGDPTGTEVWTPIARLGVDAIESVSKPNRTLTALGGRITACYSIDAAMEPTNEFGRVLRYATMDTSKRFVKCAFDDAGVTVVAGAQPAYWDGFEVVEIAPMFLPVIHVETTDGGLEPGYSFTAIYVWTDGAGQEHRSAPATPVLIELEAWEIDNIWVTWPFTFKNGFDQRAVRIELYCKSPTSTVHTLVQGNADQVTVVDTSNGVCVLAGVHSGDVNDRNRALYSESELANGSPGAVWDVCVVGPRAWIINAEYRGRAQHSKLKRPGIAYEFPGEFELVFPPSSGDLEAITEVDGNPVMMAANGVYVVLGPGPSNAGDGVEFADPRRISDIGCVSRDSVIRTPVGTLFASQDCFAIIESGGAVSQLVEADPRTLGTIVGTALFVSTQEALFFGDGSGDRTCLVYNYEAKKWSEWTHLSESARINHATLDPVEGVALVTSFAANESLGEPGRTLLTKIRPGGYSQDANTHVHIKTGWIQPNGPQAACVIRELIVESYCDRGAYGLELDVQLDYKATSQQKVWEHEDISAATENERVTLLGKLRDQPARSVLFAFTETDGPDVEGGTERGSFCPLHSTLTFGPAEGVQRKFKPTAVK